MKTSHICIACKYEINNAVYQPYLPASLDKLSEFDDLKKEGDAITASLQTDFTNNKPLEIDFILGYVVSLAKEKGIDCPYSTTLVASLDRYKKGPINEKNP